MKIKRILQIGMSSFHGGVENSIMNYYRHIDKKNIQFDFVCTDGKLAYSEEIEALGGEVFYLANPRKHPLKFKKQFESLIISNNYSTVHVNMLSAANIIPALSAKILDVEKIIIHAHNASLPSGILRKILHEINKPLLSYIATDYWACSNLAAKWLFTKKIINNTGFKIIKNAINISGYSYNHESRNKMRKKLGISNELVIGHVGRFAEEKNHSYLIEIFLEIQKERKDAKLLLVGDGVLRNKIEQQLINHGLTDSVFFLGEISNVLEIYSAMDIFCLPSIFEGLGIVLIEAQAAGLLCACSDSIPTEAIVTNNVLQFQLNDSPKKLAMRILNKYDNYERSDTNNLLVKAGYNILEVSKELENYYLN